MTEPLASYLPQDRRQALARGLDLPDRTTGSALFADISGFTPLTEALARTLGARRGAEALTQQINRVYEALIAEVDRYGGSVVGFAGDSVTCWFAAQDQGPRTKDEVSMHVIDTSSLVLGPSSAAPRAVACARSLQDAMRQFVAVPLPDGATTELALKVAIATGPARRFVVGDPAIQCLDALTGATLERMASGEHLAHQGEILIDAATATALVSGPTVADWRADAVTGERFAVLAGLQIEIDPADNQSVIYNLQSEIVRPWLLPAVYARHHAGLGEFLTELRPAVALFLRFMGIDYEHDPDAGSTLDAFVRRVQQTLARYDGILLQLTIGDKGSYLYAAFGAPIAHEDDPQRAVAVALDLQAAAAIAGLAPLQIGISRGVMRAGPYGSATRRSYGVLGDDVNLAARLMAQASPGEVLISGRVQPALGAAFSLEPRAPIRLKGKAEPLPVFAVLGPRQRRAIRLEEPAYTLPMVGREADLALIAHKLDLALAGQGQVVGIVAEAGMGKSRLLAEVIRLARQHGLAGYGGACQSYGAHTPYLVWQPIWRAFFDVNPAAPPRRQLRALAGLVEEWAPDRMEALPLLGPLLGLDLAENDFTRGLDPQSRKSALHALLLDCLSAAAREAAEDDAGLLLVLEDLHWIDALSHDLLEEVARAIVDLPMLIVLAYRPPELLRLQAPLVEALAHFTRISLAELQPTDAEQLIRAKLAQLFPERGGAAPPMLIARITEKAQGNPFYVEELLNYLRDLGIDPHDTTMLAGLELPSSLHTLLLSRIDQLSERERATLKVASVFGRLFRFAWLHGAYPLLGAPEGLHADLDELARLDLTPLDTPEPELTYLFKHIVTQEVAYASLTAQARAALHEQLAIYLELLAGEDAKRFLDLLAYHYERSENLVKKRKYLRLAGEAAAARYANEAALDHLARALALTPKEDIAERYALLLLQEQVADLQSRSDVQVQCLEALTVLAEGVQQAEVSVRRARYLSRICDYPGAIAAAQHALELTEGAEASSIRMEAHLWRAWALREQGEYAAAHEQGAESLRLAELLGDERSAGKALEILSWIAWFSGDMSTARATAEQCLHLARRTGDARDEANALNALGMSAWGQQDYAAARIFHERNLALARTVGDRGAEAFALGNLGWVILSLGDDTAAQAAGEQSLQLQRMNGEPAGEGLYRTLLGMVAQRQGRGELALTHSRQAAELLRAVGQRWFEGVAQLSYGHALLDLGRADEAAVAYGDARTCWGDVDERSFALEARAGLARVALVAGDLAGAGSHVEAILAALARSGCAATFEPLRVYLTCYRVLLAIHDQRAADILEEAYTLLQEWVAALPDAATRRMFVDNVPYHREIVAAWEQQ